MTSRIPFPPSSHSGSREYPGVAPLHSMIGDSGSHSGSHSGVGMNPLSHGGAVPLTTPRTPWQKLAASFIFATNQFGLKALARFRSATQEQQIIGVMIGTATLAILLVLLFWAIIV